MEDAVTIATITIKDTIVVQVPNAEWDLDELAV